MRKNPRTLDYGRIERLRELIQFLKNSKEVKTQKGVCEKAGLLESDMSAILTYKKNATDFILNKILRAFKFVSKEWLFYGYGSIIVGDKYADVAKDTAKDFYARFKIQPQEFIIKNDLSFVVGKIIVYACRYNEVGNVDDLLKLKSYAETLICMHYNNSIPQRNDNETETRSDKPLEQQQDN